MKRSHGIEDGDGVREKMRKRWVSVSVFLSSHSHTSSPMVRYLLIDNKKGPFWKNNLIQPPLCYALFLSSLLHSSFSPSNSLFFSLFFKTSPFLYLELSSMSWSPLVSLFFKLVRSSIIPPNRGSSSLLPFHLTDTLHLLPLSCIILTLPFPAFHFVLFPTFFCPLLFFFLNILSSPRLQFLSVCLFPSFFFIFSFFYFDFIIIIFCSCSK